MVGLADDACGSMIQQVVKINMVVIAMRLQDSSVSHATSIVLPCRDVAIHEPPHVLVAPRTLALLVKDCID